MSAAAAWMKFSSSQRSLALRRPYTRRADRTARSNLTSSGWFPPRRVIASPYVLPSKKGAGVLSARFSRMLPSPWCVTTLLVEPLTEAHTRSLATVTCRHE